MNSDDPSNPNLDAHAPLPSVSLPKGGGAIRGIGEKFGTNAVTGTATASVPITTSPGRSSFGPQLALTYDSGFGNGPFGFGWRLEHAAVSRKTDHGIPSYLDESCSDVFVLAGAEDLVPVTDGNGDPVDDTSMDAAYTIRRYRPRIDGLFARIERWTSRSNNDVHWRSLSRDNVLTIYGADPRSRISDPAQPAHVFSWLICESRDTNGNLILYEYKAEDGAGVPLGRASERNRGSRADIRRSANRYLKRILYCNRTPRLDAQGKRPRFLTKPVVAGPAGDDYLMEVVFDYGDHHETSPTPNEATEWPCRVDAFSSYRSGFEVRTNRLCRRVLMFHHFPSSSNGWPGYDGLVRSTDLAYAHSEMSTEAPYNFLVSATQTGHMKIGTGYQSKSLPPLEFEYSHPHLDGTIHDVDPSMLANLPIGVDNREYQWADLHGEGVSGVLAPYENVWYYTRNLSPISEGDVVLGATERVVLHPAPSLTGSARLMDLTGDGSLDVVDFRTPTPGFFEHDGDEGWHDFTPFSARLGRDISDPNLRFVDFDGDGQTDVLVTQADRMVWHESRGEAGFESEIAIAVQTDDELGPRVVLGDATGSVYLADMSGDGLSDLVVVQESSVAYYPNLGRRFGAKVTMDDAPHFDNPERFDHRRLRLADIDGSGTSDLIYLHAEGVRIAFNRSGNSWSDVVEFDPIRVDDGISIQTTDLLGNGTACLVWSSSLPGDAMHPMRYMKLMQDGKPHLLSRIINNLGAETLVDYASSTKFYLQDRRDNHPWLTRLAFPVHVVERVRTIDRIGRNVFGSTYRYHHGYFDGDEREFRGFAMVEQLDTAEIGHIGDFDPTNVERESSVPTVLTKTWFHTGSLHDRRCVSNYFAGLLDGVDVGEYYRERLGDEGAAALLLPDSTLPPELPGDELREAMRALKGSMLRQEVYALDASSKEPHPYTVVEQNYRVRRHQGRGKNQHAVFSILPSEALTYHYERDPTDPRVQHALTLEADEFNTPLKEAVVAYGRRPNRVIGTVARDRSVQTASLLTYTEHTPTDAIVDPGSWPDDHRVATTCQSRTYELTGYTPAQGTRFMITDFVRPTGTTYEAIFDSEIEYSARTSPNQRQRRLVTHVRTLFRNDDLTRDLPLGSVESRGTPGRTYKLALTSQMLASVYRRSGQSLVSDPVALLGAQTSDGGGYVLGDELKTSRLFPAEDPAGQWWVPSGTTLYSPNDDVSEFSYAADHFFLAARHQDAFHMPARSTETSLHYDDFDLLPVRAEDAVGNLTTVGQRASDGTIAATKPGVDYRVLEPILVTDPNLNRSAVAFDVMGMVVVTASMGKTDMAEGDSIEGPYVVDLPDNLAADHLAEPLIDPLAILGTASKRLVYDFGAYRRTSTQAHPQPAVIYSVARDTHLGTDAGGQITRFQHSFTYSDGFGREIQKKLQAEPGDDGGPRWVGSGWTIYNNKGKPVRRYEPFFSDTHGFQFGEERGVSSVLFYDPLDRVVATIHPNHAYEKVVYGPWHQVTYDMNDTVTYTASNDPDIGGFVAGYFRASANDGWRSWYEERVDGSRGPHEQNAAYQAAAHEGTPTTVHFDSLGRAVRTVVDKGPDPARPDQHMLLSTRVILDIEGNQLEVRDAVTTDVSDAGRLVMLYVYDMLGNPMMHQSMDAGSRWALNDASGKPIRAWDGRGHRSRNEYDVTRRPTHTWVTGADPTRPTAEVLTDLVVYGEQATEAAAHNLRGRALLQFDQAGVASSDAFDFKGNPIRISRWMTTGRRYCAVVDWKPVADAGVIPADPRLSFKSADLDTILVGIVEPDGYVSAVEYDALNRPRVITRPHITSMTPNVLRHRFNEAGLLESVEAQLRPPDQLAADGAWTSFVTDISYNAKGQRASINYANGVVTSYAYDEHTFRLTTLTSTRKGAAGSLQTIQALSYTYDPVGNIIHVQDDAQQTVIFKNQVVSPSSDFTYDALYRLTDTASREHLGQAGAPFPYSWNDKGQIGVLNSDGAGRFAPTDGKAMGRYTERYAYDAVGNLLTMRHIGTDPASPGWTRSFAYQETSLVEDGEDGGPKRVGNRLTSTNVGAEHPAGSYAYDEHGNTTRVPHLGTGDSNANMWWNHHDQLMRADKGGGGTAYYVYDAGGERVRKVWEKPGGRIEERLYLGGLEIYRQVEGSQTLVRETLHVMDDQQRIAVVETRTLDTARDDRAPAALVRFQLGNHLGSAVLEVDANQEIVTYEEYSPYGSTTYQAVRSATETPKRYRFTAKERDEETGFNYHRARYYAPWLARWVSCDPSQLRDGPNAYTYVGGEPSRRIDTTGHQGYGPWHEQMVMQQMAETIRPVARVANGVEEFGGGIWDGTRDMAVGLYTIARHPIQTVEGLASAVANPSRSLGAIGGALKDFGGKLAEGDPRAWGRGVFEVASLVVATTKVGKVSKVAQVGELVDGARVIEKFAEASKVTKIAQVSEIAADTSRVGTTIAEGSKVTAAAEEGATLFRGTTVGYEGSEGVLRAGITPASTDPVVATTFATQAEQHGEGVLQIATSRDLAGLKVELNAGYLKYESEAHVATTPLEFAARSSKTIPVDVARNILSDLGIEVPGRIVGKEGITRFLGPRTPTDLATVAEFLKRAGMHK